MNDIIRVSYCWRWWTRLLALIFCAGFSWVVWRKGESSAGAWIAQLLVIGGFTLAAVSGETLIDPHRRHVQRVWKLFGVVPLLCRTFSSESFREVQWRRRWTEGEADSQHWVELVLKSGRALVLTTFVSLEQDHSCGDANALALQIAECLRLPFAREPETYPWRGVADGRR